MLLAALLMGLMGYFIDAECLLHHCEPTSVATGHGECISPVVLPDASQTQPPVQVSEFPTIPALLEVAVACLPSDDVERSTPTFWPLRPPPEHLRCSALNCRRGPPARA